jgi:hypothetical protein
MTAVADYRFWKHALLWFGVLLVLMARVPLLWQSGEFVGEDGWVFFAEAFNEPWRESLLTPFAGYFRLEARILAELLSGLPWGAQPYAYALAGLALNALVLSLFYLPNFRSLLAPDVYRIAVVALLALAPNAENLGLLTGLHWYLSFALTLMLVMDPPDGSIGRMALVLASSVCVWSAPSALVLLPFFAFRWLKVSDPFLRRWSAAVVIQLVLYAISILVLQGTEGTRSGDFDRGVIFWAAEHLMVRGWFVSGVWGQGVSQALVQWSPLAVDFLGYATMSLLAWLIWRTRETRDLGPILLVVAAGLMVMFSLTRTAYIEELAVLDLPKHVRYLTAPTLVLIVGIWVLAGRLLRAGARWWWGLFGVQGAVLLSGIAAESHWSRSPEEFRFRDQIAAIETFEREYLEEGRVGSLYLPNDVPYWGAVLESAGGEMHRPEDGILVALALDPKSAGWVESWLGSFRILEGNKRIEHEHWGRLTFTGVELGRVWFEDPAGRQLFTSKLLYPRAWRIDGFAFTLIDL